jgi:outer membrane protein
MEIALRGKSKIGIMLLLLGLSTGLAGEARAAGLQVIGLDQLIQMALEKSPELLESDQDILAALSDLNQAKAGQWAQIDVTGFAGPVQDAKTPVVVVNPTPKSGALLGLIQDRDDNAIGIFGDLELSIVQPLYTFGKISHRQDAAAYGVDAQRSAKEKKRGEIILNTKQLYFGLLVARQGKGAADDADAFIQDARKRIQRLLDLGSKNADQSDFYRLAAFEADIQQFKAKAEAGAQVAYLALKKAIGFPDGQDFQLDTRELPKDTRALGTQEEFVRRALDQRPELEQLKKGIAAKQSMVEAAKADLYPSFFAAGIGSFAEAPGRDHLTTSYIRDEFNHVEMGGVVGAEWHFDMGIGRAKVSRAKAEHRKLLHTKEFAERNIPLEVAKYYQDALEAEVSFKAFEKGAIAARKWIVAAFANFDMGVGNAKDMFDAIDRYGKNQGEYLLALYNYHVSLANLSYAVGEYRFSNP